MNITASFKHRWITLDVSTTLIDGYYDDIKIYFEDECREVSNALYDVVFVKAMEALQDEKMNRDEWGGFDYDI